MTSPATGRWWRRAGLELHRIGLEQERRAGVASIRIASAFAPDVAPIA